MVDRFNKFEELDERYKLTRFGKTDRINTFYKLILLHRFFNRKERWKREFVSKKRKNLFRKYMNTLNLRFSHGWNSILKQYSKKFLLPTNFKHIQYKKDPLV